ncbi:hypothetical protein [Sapientia aquatica]|uniref:Uncharacterized protein n=1 Tax=Sapientia aquatica TaxID=1549640 RepID=A0A4R5W341_9BURK|nr:hypothetical protein [Sapientia aquatica]TDK67133.1 hypothetical protein E2I14_05050 [Sapientia aquatica]
MQLNQTVRHDQRTDNETSNAINRVLAITLLDGKPAGKRQIKREHIPIGISSRVMADQAKRRASDWK